MAAGHGTMEVRWPDAGDADALSAAPPGRAVVVVQMGDVALVIPEPAVQPSPARS